MISIFCPHWNRTTNLCYQAEKQVTFHHCCLSLPSKVCFNSVAIWHFMHIHFNTSVTKHSVNCLAAQLSHLLKLQKANWIIDHVVTCQSSYGWWNFKIKTCKYCPSPTTECQYKNKCYTSTLLFIYLSAFPQNVERELRKSCTVSRHLLRIVAVIRNLHGL